MSLRSGASAAGAARTALLLLLLSSLALGACSLFRPASPAGPSPTDATDGAAGAADSSGSDNVENDPADATAPEPDLGERLRADALLALADSELAAGNPTAAADVYLRLAEEHPYSDEAAQALFQLVALQLDPSSPLYDSGAAVVTLERIEADHSQSLWAPAAALLLELTRRNADLERTLQTVQTQLDQLKKLDLASDLPDG